MSTWIKYKHAAMMSVVFSWRHLLYGLGVKALVFNTTFNNISVISWQSVLVGKTTDLPQVIDKLYHIMLYRVHLATSVLCNHDHDGPHLLYMFFKTSAAYFRVSTLVAQQWIGLIQQKYTKEKLIRYIFFRSMLII